MKLFLLYLGFFLTSFSLSAETEQQRITHYNLKSGLAIQGYDPVSYFSGKAKKGSSKNSYQHHGVTYHFSSPENLTLFKNKPAQYEPQYGGWCAYAFAIGKDKVKINPKSYKIINNKLYLFYHTFPTNTLKRWNKQEDAEQLQKADQVWESFFK